jgi:hypothetical protein
MSGLVECQRDAYKQTFHATVTAVSKVEEKAKGDGKNEKKKAGKGGKGDEKSEAKSEAAAPEAKATYHVQLSDTILYPEGGGQVRDHSLSSPVCLVCSLSTWARLAVCLCWACCPVRTARPTITSPM